MDVTHISYEDAGGQFVSFQKVTGKVTVVRGNYLVQNSNVTIVLEGFSSLIPDNTVLIAKADFDVVAENEVLTFTAHAPDSSETNRESLDGTDVGGGAAVSIITSEPVPDSFDTTF